MALRQAALDETALRNMREFLETYNKISESCFNRCVVSLHDRALSDEEVGCANVCTERNVSVNHKVLQAFMVEQPKINEEKMKEAEKLAEQMMQQQQQQETPDAAASSFDSIKPVDGTSQTAES